MNHHTPFLITNNPTKAQPQFAMQRQEGRLQEPRLLLQRLQELVPPLLEPTLQHRHHLRPFRSLQHSHHRIRAHRRPRRPLRGFLLFPIHTHFHLSPSNLSLLISLQLLHHISRELQTHAATIAQSPLQRLSRQKALLVNTPDKLLKFPHKIVHSFVLREFLLERRNRGSNHLYDRKTAEIRRCRDSPESSSRNTSYYCADDVPRLFDSARGTACVD